MNQNEILFAVTLISFCIGILGKAWQLSASVAEMKHSFQVQDIRLENLAALHDTTFTGFRERIDHSTSRLRGESDDLSKRVEDLEAYLTKTTEFIRRR